MVYRMIRLILGLIVIGVLDIILLIITPNLNSIVPDWNGYKKSTMTFDGKLTFSDGKLTFYIDNNQDNSKKMLSIYGVDKKNPIKIFVSNMIVPTNNTVKDEHIRFNDMATLPINNNGTINVSVPFISSGILQGWIFVEGKNNSSIPLTIAADPKTAEAVSWILVGILTSILFWEVILYFKPPKPGAGGAAHVAAQVAAKDAAKEVAEAVAREVAKEGPKTKAADVASQKSREIADRAKSVAASYRHDYENLRYPRPFIPSSHVWLLDIVTVIFGIGVGLLAVFSQGYANELRVIGAWDIVALLGLGLGIGSLHSQS